MEISSKVLKKDDIAIFKLRELYRKYGYSQYKMSKFEEYDLYVRNKDFLVSDNIITFTDTDGKLMALKPDVTLSIIKNSRDEGNCVSKVYYNENVYRVSPGTHSYKEIMQTGLECIGAVDDYAVYEVLMLAAESLKSISEDFVLDISQLDIVSAVIDSLGLEPDAEREIIKCIGEKNTHGIEAVCTNTGVSPDTLVRLVTAYGNPENVIPTLREIVPESASCALDRLTEIVASLEKGGLRGKIKIDFSVINDMGYYNGFVFRGFINGLAAGVLSGGQYDNLMTKMGRKSRAIGFAVYLDMLERLGEDDGSFDVDAVLLYGEDDKIDLLNDAVSMLTSNGKSVMAQREVPEKIKYRQLLRLRENGVDILENNA